MKKVESVGDDLYVLNVSLWLVSLLPPLTLVSPFSFLLSSLLSYNIIHEPASSSYFCEVVGALEICWKKMLSGRQALEWRHSIDELGMEFWGWGLSFRTSARPSYPVAWVTFCLQYRYILLGPSCIRDLLFRGLTDLSHQPRTRLAL